MILTVVLAIVFALALLGLLFWLLLPLALEKKSAKNGCPQKLEKLGPLHSQHFPQIRQVLSTSDDSFLRPRISAQARGAWQAERRRVLRNYLSGLREDFDQLDCMARTVAALSPRVNRAQETERFWLSVQFRMLYRIAAVRVAAGSVSLPQVERLTQLVGGLAAQIEAGMAALERDSASQLGAAFSA